MRNKVLIIDDDRALTHMLTVYLSKYGFFRSEILVAYDPIEALKLFNQYQNSIISVICDFYMPRANGDELCEIIKSNQPSTYVIMQSADKQLQKGKMSFVDAVIHKPFNYSSFECVLKRCFKV